jgi:hypothetical protein
MEILIYLLIGSVSGFVFFIVGLKLGAGIVKEKYGIKNN